MVDPGRDPPKRGPCRTMALEPGLERNVSPGSKAMPILPGALGEQTGPLLEHPSSHGLCRCHSTSFRQLYLRSGCPGASRSRPERWTAALSGALGRVLRHFASYGATESAIGSPDRLSRCASRVWWRTAVNRRCGVHRSGSGVSLPRTPPTPPARLRAAPPPVEAVAFPPCPANAQRL